MIIYFDTVIMIPKYLLPTKSMKNFRKSTKKVLSRKQINLLPHNKVHAFLSMRENFASEFASRQFIALNDTVVQGILASSKNKIISCNQFMRLCVTNHTYIVHVPLTVFHHFKIFFQPFGRISQIGKFHSIFYYNSKISWQD